MLELVLLWFMDLLTLYPIIMLAEMWLSCEGDNKKRCYSIRSIPTKGQMTVEKEKF